MKKTRKVLALVLVFAMMLSIGALAASSTHAASICENVEASSQIKWCSDTVHLGEILDVKAAIVTPEEAKNESINSPQINYQYRIDYPARSDDKIMVDLKFNIVAEGETYSTTVTGIAEKFHG